MATKAHCLYCFEVLAASLEKRQALELRQVEELWEQYCGISIKDSAETEDDDVEMTEDEDAESEEDVEEEEQDTIPVQSTPRPKEISRLQAASSASDSSSSTPSSATSSQSTLSNTSKASSRSSLFSFIRRPSVKEEEYPLFVTWNTVSERGNKHLRGCIGTFEAHKLSSGLRSYALTSAFDDVRFRPISLQELPTLSNYITLLLDFTPCKDALDWDLGKHGIRISFTHQGRRYGSTYLPNVATEQGWNKEETIISLMRKAGWPGRSSEWRKVSDMKCIRYEGRKADVSYREWRAWRTWVENEAKF